jgi:hypothetical protein
MAAAVEAAMRKLTICLLLMFSYASVCAAQIQSQFLQASDWAEGDGFGTLVAIDGDTAVVVAICAPNDPSSDCNLSGDSAIYFFNGVNNVWTQVAETACPNPCGNDNYSVLGPSLAISGDVIALGMPQANVTYLYVKPAGGWVNGMSPTAILTASDSGSYGAFGVSVVISENTVIVTAAGAAYVYVEPATGWANMTQTAELTPSTPDSAFGWAYFASQQGVMIGDTIVIGEPYQSTTGPNGWINVFVEPPGGWVNANPSSRINLNLPYCLATAGNYLGVGAGNIYIYKLSNGVLTEQAQISPPGDGEFWYCPLVMSGSYLFASEFEGHTIGNNPVFVYKEPKSGWVNTNKPYVTLNPWPNNLLPGASASLAATTESAGALIVGENSAARYECKAFCPGPGGAVIYWP